MQIIKIDQKVLLECKDFIVSAFDWLWNSQEWRIYNLIVLFLEYWIFRRSLHTSLILILVIVWL